MARDIATMTIYDKVQEPLSEKQLSAIDNIEEFVDKATELQTAFDTLDAELRAEIANLHNEIDQIPAGGTVVVEDAVVKNSQNPVKSSGIYSALNNLSTSTVNAALDLADNNLTNACDQINLSVNQLSVKFNNDLNAISSDLKDKIDEKVFTVSSVTKDETRPVSSKGIWEFGENLSNSVLNAIPDAGETIAIADTVTSDGINPVKSAGIWEFGRTLSTNILENIPDSQTITIDNEITKNGTNPVNSSGIYSALCEVSAQTRDITLNLANNSLTDAYTHLVTESNQLSTKLTKNLNVISTFLNEKIDNQDVQITIDSAIYENSKNPVENSAIYDAMHQLSDNIMSEVIDLQPEIEIDNNVTVDGQQPVKSSGIWEFGDALSTDIMLSTDAKISQISENGNTYIANNTYISYDIGRFKYNNGRTFDSSISVDGFIKAGTGKWDFIHSTTLTNTFHAKIIAVSPGDVITYKKKPWNKSDSYYTSYMRALSSFNPSNVVYNANAPLDGSIKQDPIASSDWTGAGNSHQFYPQDQLYTGGAFTTAYYNSTGNWYKQEHSLSTYLGITNYSEWSNDGTFKGMHIHNTELEISVKVPMNTHYLYVSTKYYNYDQEFDSFKINGYELVDQQIEKSASINSFNMDSTKNRNNHIVGIGKNGIVFTTENTAKAYMLTHFIPCQYGDQIILSENNANNLRFARSVEYYDENFNLLSVRTSADNNNGFDWANWLHATDLYRGTVVLVEPIPFVNCKYVRIGIPTADNGIKKNNLENDPIYSTNPLLSAANATMIQVVHLKDYPQYMLKEHNDFVRFQKKYSDDIKQPLIPQLEGKKLLFFGDSLTRNSLTSTSDLPTAGSPSIFTYDQVSGSTTKVKGYVHYLCEDLHCSYINAGDGGDTAALSSHSESERESLADRLSNWNSGGFPANISSEIQKADAAFVEIGTNDWAYSWTEFGDPTASTEGTTTFCDSIRYICTKLHNILGNSVPIVFLTPLKRQQQTDSGTGILYTEQNNIGKTLSDYVSAIKTICQNYNAYVIDLFNICKINPAGENHQSGSYYRKRYIPDGTHPSSLGHNVIAKCIEKKLPDIIANFYSSFDTIESMIDQSSESPINPINNSKPTQLWYNGQEINLNYIENADKSKPVAIDFGE